MTSEETWNTYHLKGIRLNIQRAKIWHKRHLYLRDFGSKCSRDSFMKQARFHKTQLI